jgi:hypothetical protein
LTLPDNGKLIDSGGKMAPPHTKSLSQPDLNAAPAIEPSPFFAPGRRQSHVVIAQQTPGGTVTRYREEEISGSSTTPIVETKSNLVGCTANLINAIVGSGYVSEIL